MQVLIARLISKQLHERNIVLTRTDESYCRTNVTEHEFNITIINTIFLWKLKILEVTLTLHCTPFLCIIRVHYEYCLLSYYTPNCYLKLPVNRFPPVSPVE